MNWQLSKLTGTKDTIKPKVADAKIPQGVKDFIAAELASLTGESAIVAVTGYSADHSSSQHPQALTRNIQITISSAIL
jgi:hypothetical protein